MSDEASRLSRRELFQAGAAAAVTAALAGVSVEQAAAQGRGAPPGTIEEIALVNGRIHTMNASNAVVNTVTMSNGRFSAVGGPTPRSVAGRRIIDLKGRTVVPGIIASGG